MKRNKNDWRTVKATAATILAAMVLSAVAAAVAAEAGVEPCTRKPASATREQPYLSKLEDAVARLSSGEPGAMPAMMRLIDHAADLIFELGKEAGMDAFVFGRAVERILEAGDLSATADPMLFTAWARFRLNLAGRLRDADCSHEAETLLAQTRGWPIGDPDIAAGVIASRAALLVSLGRRHEAISAVYPFFEAESSPRSFTGFRAHFTALNNLAVALRRIGRRSEALRVYQRALVLATDSVNKALIRTEEQRQNYESVLASLYLNLAALALYNQDTEETWSYLRNSRAALERSGQTESVAMVEWHRVMADYRSETGDDVTARENLRDGLDLASRVAPESVALRSELLRRIAQLDGAEPASLRKLRENDRALEMRPGADQYAKVMSARAIADAYGELQDWTGAVEWARIANHRMRSVAGGPTVESALIQIYLASALANAWQIMEAYEVSRAAARTLREFAEREAIGCRIGEERNAEVVEEVRHWHGVLASLVSQNPGIEGTYLETEVANEVLGLVQAQETDRIGAAALHAAARNRLSSRRTVQDYEDLLNEKCAVDKELRRLSAAPQPDHVLLGEKYARVRDLEHQAAATLAGLDPILASALSGGRQTLTRDELSQVLRPGEALLGFRIGKGFSVGSLNIQHGNGDKLTTATIPLPDATKKGVATQVSEILNAIEAGKPWEGAGSSLSEMLWMTRLQSILAEHGVRHVFVVPDGHLRRLPSHLLPVGTAVLGDFVDSSTIASIWGFAALRMFGRVDTRSRAVFAIGEPELHDVPCNLIPMPPTTLHREVMCLGKPLELEDLLVGAHNLLGGPPPAMGAEATRTAMLGSAPREAGIVLFGTHGLIPETKEVSYLDEPALVLSPSQTDPDEDGLLLASQVADMRLDDSWLAILAACRTGTPSGTDVSDGLSGLAWGFTSAGTDALLVTHWATLADATREVVLSILGRMEADPTLSLASALGEAMRAYARKHPNTHEWGGFAILGDGTVTMPPP